MSLRALMLSGVCLLLSACDGAEAIEGQKSGHSVQNPVGVLAPKEPPDLVLRVDAVKFIRFDWVDVFGASHYRLMGRSDSFSKFVQLGENIPAGMQTFELNVPLHDRLNAQYFLQACNKAGCVDSGVLSLGSTLVERVGFLRISKAGATAGFGNPVSVSADGQTLAVGVGNEKGIAGGVVVFSRETGVWSQQAYLVASQSESGKDGFGESVSLSADGQVLAVGAGGDGGGVVDGDAFNGSLAGSGAVYVFVRDEAGEWRQNAKLKASNANALDFFGIAVSLSADGKSLAVGATGEDSASTGANGDQADNSATGAGAVYVFRREAEVWHQEAYLKASNTNGLDFFGVSVSVSADGHTLAVGAFGESASSKSVGAAGVPADNSVSSAGAVYVFARDSEGWAQRAYLKASDAKRFDFFGVSVCLSSDGERLAVGAIKADRSFAAGAGGSQSNNFGLGAGAVYVFSLEPVKGEGVQRWVRKAYVDLFALKGSAKSALYSVLFG